MSTVFYGALVTPASLTDYLALPHALLAVSKNTGVIEWVEEDDSEFEREWREWKSRPGTFVGNICMLTAVISRRRVSGTAGVIEGRN